MKLDGLFDVLDVTVDDVLDDLDVLFDLGDDGLDHVLDKLEHFIIIWLFDTISLNTLQKYITY